MKSLFRFASAVLRSKWAIIFLVTNVLLCLLFTNWSPVSYYFDHLNDLGCRPPSRIDFSFYRGSVGLVEIIVNAFYALLFLPAVIDTETVLSLLKKAFPSLCPETFNLLYMPIFGIFNSFHWLLLGFVAEISYTRFSINKTLAVNPLGLISNS